MCAALASYRSQLEQSRKDASKSAQQLQQQLLRGSSAGRPAPKDTPGPPKGPGPSKGGVGTAAAALRDAELAAVVAQAQTKEMQARHLLCVCFTP